MGSGLFKHALNDMVDIVNGRFQRKSPMGRISNPTQNSRVDQPTDTGAALL